MRIGRALALGSAGIVLTAGLTACSAGPAVAPAESTSSAEVHLPARVATAQPMGGASAPLAGRTIVIDPGHQLGNRHFPRQINRPVPAGGFTKPCNTTGTSTNGGYPEATFVWKVSKELAKRLRAKGAKVRLTRRSNSDRRWGPCVDVRGRAGNKIRADLKISIHADGSYAVGARGFHVIYPPKRAPWTADIHRPSKRFAVQLRKALLRAGFTRATYTAGGDGLDERSDLGTLNLSDIPVAMVELGNMRSAEDAAVMTRPAGRQRYAVALMKGILAHFGR